MHIEDRSDRLPDAVAEAARAYHSPPVPPREAMWRAILAQRDRHSIGARGIYATRRPWGVAAVAAAAVLALWLVLPPAATREAVVLSETRVDAAVPVAPAFAQGDVALQLAAREHLERAEAVLALARSDLRAGVRDASIVGHARDLLLDTRLLLDLARPEEAELRELLSGLELVLVQLAYLDVSPTADELALAANGLESSDILPRLYALMDEGM